MIGIKHFMDAPEVGDGKRIWVEPTGLTRDLRLWCRVDYVLPELGPPGALVEWFGRHPSRYRAFRDGYQQHLVESGRMPALRRLARASSHDNVTLLHQGDRADQNTATALREMVCKFCPSQAQGKRTLFERPSGPANAALRGPDRMRAAVCTPFNPCEAAAPIYEWQIVIDDTPQIRAGRRRGSTVRLLLSDYVRQLKYCAWRLRKAVHWSS